MRRKARHIPRSGYSFALNGLAYCGRYAEYATGDHALIYRQATMNPNKFCKQCLVRFRRVFKGQVWTRQLDPHDGSIFQVPEFVRD